MKQKRTYSRKQKGLRWLGRLVLLVLLLNVTGIYPLNPDKTMTASLQQSGIAPVEVIHREKAQYRPVENWLFLVGENREALTLCAAQFDPLMGWYNRSGVHAIPLSNPEFHEKSWIIHDKNHDRAAVILFGFVPTGEKPPTFKIGTHDYRAPFGEGFYEDLSEYVVVGETYFDGEPYTVTPTPTIPVRGGMCYLKQVSLTHKTLDQDHWDTIVLCDRTGQWEKCKYWTSSWLG